jgi:hypothetical protein
MACVNDRHSQGAEQTGASTPEVTRVSAIIPIPAALTAPHTTAVIPRMNRILAYFCIIFYHNSPVVQNTMPGLYYDETIEPVLYGCFVENHGMQRVEGHQTRDRRRTIRFFDLLGVISSEGRLRLLS